MENEKIKKPFTLRCKETEENIILSINNSELPVYVLKTILQSIFNQLDKIDTDEIQKYNLSIKKDGDK